jgi:probable F420-dependent oxidoreductase
MRFSLDLPTQRVAHPAEFVTGEAIADIARAASAAGFSAVNVTDHPAPDAKWLDNGGHHALDPFVALSFAAAADPTIRLHTNIYVAAYRNPFLGAKLIQSLDVLSGGRLLLGVAAGYLKPEFAALGVDFDRRGELLDEALSVLDAVASGDDVAWRSAGVNARGVRLRPIAPSGRRPPVWVGGNSKAAIRRAVRYDGWAPFHTGGFAKFSRTAAIENLADLREAIATVRSYREQAQADQPFDVCWSEALMGDLTASTDQRLDRVADLESAGVTWITVDLPGANRAEFVQSVTAFGREIIGARVNA